MAEPVIEACRLWKRFGHVEALRGASMAVGRGEIVALVGDNGAGKSTLLKVVCGAMAADGGEVRIAGRRLEPASVITAQRLGVDVVYQDLALAPHLTVAQSIFLGHEVVHGGWRAPLGVLARQRMRRDADDALRVLGIVLPAIDARVQELSGGQQQAVAMARAVKWSRRAILLDEPTAALGTKQTQIVIETLRSAARRGLGVLVISHDMPRMLQVADRIVVLRHGRTVADLHRSEATLQGIVLAMLGEEEARGAAPPS